MITLRKLELKDAPFMYEWMHDVSVTKDLRADFENKSMEDCKRFIVDSWNDEDNLHLAISDDSDSYQGTVSLKNIIDNTAEFAIVIRSSAMRKGVAKAAMEQIINIGFLTKGIHSIYWSVSPNNKRAVRFYDKNGYSRISPDLIVMGGYEEEEILQYIWYRKTK